MSKNLKALVVDDSLLSRRMIKDQLSANGFSEIFEAANGYEAVEKFKKNSPDFVTMDIVMPDKDGLETLKEIMDIDPGAKVVMISSIGQEHYISASKRLGAKTHIVKPITSESIKKGIAEVFPSGKC